jgi:hypothetical protein
MLAYITFGMPTKSGTDSNRFDCTAGSSNLRVVIVLEQTRRRAPRL